MDKTIKNISEVAFFFFFTTGALHIVSSLLIAQNIFTKPDWLIFNSFDLPFLFSGLIFMTTKLSQQLEDIFGDIRLPVILLGTVSTFIFAFALYLNFVLPDASIIT